MSNETGNEVSAQLKSEINKQANHQPSVSASKLNKAISISSEMAAMRYRELKF